MLLIVFSIDDQNDLRDDRATVERLKRHKLGPITTAQGEKVARKLEPFNVVNVLH